jgi:hypothetical protein
MLLKQAAEVCRATKAPGERDVSYGSAAKRYFFQITAAFFQSSRPDILRNCRGFIGKRHMQIALRTVQGRRDLVKAEVCSALPAFASGKERRSRIVRSRSASQSCVTAESSLKVDIKKPWARRPTPSRAEKRCADSFVQLNRCLIAISWGMMTTRCFVDDRQVTVCGRDTS